MADGASATLWQKSRSRRAIRNHTLFSSSKAKACTRSLLAQCMPGLSSQGHFRFTANGETVVRLEERLGYTHKGIESLITGASVDAAARLAARTSGDSTVAYGFAFARAVEAALGIEIPPRAIWLRALMAELERLANHFGDIGAICNDAGFAIMLAHCGVLRERVLRTVQACFGHRLMMDCIVPGGVGFDLPSRGFEQIRELVWTIGKAFPPLAELYDNTASLQDRTVGTGLARPSLIKQYGCGGIIGRASARAFDARVQLSYPPMRQCFSITTWLCLPRATSMRDSGFASARWSRA